MSKERSNVLFDSLMAQTENPRLKASLERVKEACDFLERSQAVITPTSVGRYCDSRWGGPKSQSIRNARETLLRYVDTRKAQQSFPTSQRRNGGEPLIQDETVRAYVSILRAERDEAIRLKNRVIEGLRKIPGVPIDELIASGFKTKSLPSPVPSAGSSPAVAVALAKLLDGDRLAKVGMELHRNRLRQAITGEVLLDKPDVEALKVLVAESDTAVTKASLGHEPVRALNE